MIRHTIEDMLSSDSASSKANEAVCCESHGMIAPELPARDRRGINLDGNVVYLFEPAQQRLSAVRDRTVGRNEQSGRRAF